MTSSPPFPVTEQIFVEISMCIQSHDLMKVESLSDQDSRIALPLSLAMMDRAFLDFGLRLLEVQYIVQASNAGDRADQSSSILSVLCTSIGNTSNGVPLRY